MSSQQQVDSPRTESSGSPKRLFSQIAFPVLIVSTGAAGLVWLSAQDTPPEQVAPEPVPLVVETVALPPPVSRFEIHALGNVVPRREVTLSAEVAGAVLVKGESIESGRHVRQNDPLLQIDPARFQLQVQELGSEIQRVAAELKQLDTESQGLDFLIELAQREAQIAVAASTRLNALALKNAIADAERESVERVELQARNTLRVLQNRRELIPVRREQLRAQRKLSELKQQQAQLSLDRTQISAPFDGVIAVVMVEQGNFVQPGDELLKLQDTSVVDVECSLRMDDLYWLWNSSAARREPGAGVPGRSPSAKPPFGTSNAVTAGAGSGFETAGTAEIERAPGVHVFEVPTADATVTYSVAGRSFHWEGRLARYEGGGVNRKTRTVLCRVCVPEPVRPDAGDGPPTLMRGMHVDVTLHVNPDVPLWYVPTRGVQPNGEVWLVEDGVLRRYAPRPARTLPDGVLFRTGTTGWNPGLRVVITQLVAPIDGSRARDIARQRTGGAVTQGNRGPAP